MKFLKIINKKKLTLIAIFSFIYIALNLIDGERGLISYHEKSKIIEELTEKKATLISQLNLMEKQNDLLTGIVDTDYLEILYREKFIVGKKNEKIFIK